jgi:hypothetical protein
LDNPADALELDDDPETVVAGWAGTFIAVEINLCGRTRNEKMWRTNGATLLILERLDRMRCPM